MKVKFAQVVASLRAQATPESTPPEPPTSPAPLVLLSRTLAAAPDDAA
jgi:hypothetical protein